MRTEISYVGDELTIFALARNWKAYYSAALAPYIRGDVAEPGAGLGTTTLALCKKTENHRWTCIEPDREMAEDLQRLRLNGTLPNRCVIHCGVLADLPVEENFDTIIYIDVLEHIEDDQSEFEVAVKHLRNGGRIVVLAPAWEHLYSPFDQKIGHFRRYSRASLTALRARGAKLEKSFYLDSVGYFASLANRLILRHDMPAESQILLWDKVMVRASRFIDPLLFRTIGRSVVAVWIKDHAS